MDRESNARGLLRVPSAALPLWMSLAALALMLGRIGYGALFHVPLVRAGDEGAVAHLWQILMAAQMPLLVFFALRWLPRLPRQAARVLAIDAGAALAAMAPVYLLHL